MSDTIKFETRLEWSNHLEKMYGASNWICEDKGDDGNWIAFYKTPNFSRSFIYDGKTRIGEV